MTLNISQNCWSWPMGKQDYNQLLLIGFREKYGRSMWRGDKWKNHIIGPNLVSILPWLLGCYYYGRYGQIQLVFLTGMTQYIKKTLIKKNSFRVKFLAFLRTFVNQWELQKEKNQKPKTSFLVLYWCSYEHILHPHIEEDQIKPPCFMKNLFQQENFLKLKFKIFFHFNGVPL